MSTELFLELSQLPEADDQRQACEQCAGIVAPTALEIDMQSTRIQILGADDDPADMTGRVVVRQGLVETLKLRDAHPDVDWVPMAEVYRPTRSFNINHSQHGSGFVYYAPDPATLVSFTTAEGMELYRWVEMAATEEIACVWLHNRDAEQAGNGLELEMLERAKSRFEGEIWLSGGATDIQHLHNLRKEGGCSALILSLEQAMAIGTPPQLRSALRGPLDVAVAVESADGEPAEAVAGCPTASAQQAQA